MHVSKVRVWILEDLMSEVEASEISTTKRRESTNACVPFEHSLENVEGFRLEKEIDDQRGIVFVNQPHHTGREKRETSYGRATVLNSSKNPFKDEENRRSVLE